MSLPIRSGSSMLLLSSESPSEEELLDGNPFSCLDCPASQCKVRKVHPDTPIETLALKCAL